MYMYNVYQYLHLEAHLYTVGVPFTLTREVCNFLDSNFISWTADVRNHKKLERVSHHSKSSTAFHGVKELTFQHTMFTYFLHKKIGNLTENPAQVMSSLPTGEYSFTMCPSLSPS